MHLGAASCFGRVERVRKYLTVQNDVDSRDASGLTALHHAVMSSQAVVASLLLDEGGADKELRTRSGESCIDLAAALTHGSSDMLHLLLSRGCSGEGDPNGGRSPFLTCVSRGDTAACLVLLPALADVDRQDAFGWTLLMHAIKKRMPVVVAALLQRGAGVNARGATALTALHLALDCEPPVATSTTPLHATSRSSAPQPEQEPAALQAEPPPEAEDAGDGIDTSYEGYLRAYQEAMYGSHAVRPRAAGGGRGRQEVVPAYTPAPAPHTTVPAAYVDMEPIALQLIELGAHVHVAGRDACTTLHLACASAMPTVALTLLHGYCAPTAAAAGRIDVNASTIYGDTALMAAVRGAGGGHEQGELMGKVVQALLQAGADVNAKDVKGYTALHFAVRAGTSLAPIALSLVRAGADPYKKAHDGSTPLAVAMAAAAHVQGEEERGLEEVLQAMRMRAGVDAFMMHSGSAPGSAPSSSSSMKHA